MSRLSALSMLACMACQAGEIRPSPLREKQTHCAPRSSACDIVFDRELSSAWAVIPPFPGVDPQVEPLDFPLEIVGDEASKVRRILRAAKGPMNLELVYGSVNSRPHVEARYVIPSTRIPYRVSGRTLHRTASAAPGLLEALVNTLGTPGSRVTIAGNGLSPLPVEILHAFDRQEGSLGAFRSGETSAPIHILEALPKEALANQLQQIAEGFAALQTDNPFASFTRGFFPDTEDGVAGLRNESRIEWSEGGVGLNRPSPSSRAESADLVLSIFGPEREHQRHLVELLEMLRECGRLYVAQNAETTFHVDLFFRALSPDTKAHYEVHRSAGLITFIARRARAR